MVGVAARVASVQLPWLTSEVEPSPDLTNHITGLETMMSEMQQRVRGSIWNTSCWTVRFNCCRVTHVFGHLSAL